MSWGDPIDLKSDGKGGIFASLREIAINFLAVLSGLRMVVVGRQERLEKFFQFPLLRLQQVLLTQLPQM